MKNKLKINVVINLLVVITTIVATMISLLSTTNVLKTTLTENYLQNNYNYSTKIALGVKDLTSDLQNRIISMAKLASYPDFDQRKLDIIYGSANENFNSIFITDENGVIQLISPHRIQYKGGQVVSAGMKLQSDTMKQALALKKPLISEPYQGTSGQMILLISSPIVNEQGDFKGVMAGTIYLESESVLNRLLNSHQFEDDSYIYAVDKHGHLIYHPDADRIDADVTENEIVNKVNHGESGFDRVTNIAGIEFFAGYSFIESLGWGIVAQTPTTALDEPLQQLLFKTITQSLTILIFLLIIVTILVKRVTKPLTRLAKFSEVAILNKETRNPAHLLTITSPIYEINQLYIQLKSHLAMLSEEIQLDGLTGIANRRTFDDTIKKWIEQKHPFSLIMVDIDKFKRINDNYGHLIGDDVIKFVAAVLSGYAKEEDLSFRYGGEEFAILLKDKNEQEAYAIAEEIRAKVSEMQSPAGEQLTVSLGITSFQQDLSPHSIIERADKALYQSKKDGRNRTTIH